MCCTRVDTEVLLANMFSSRNYSGEGITAEQLANCVRYLANRLPGYLDSDVSLSRLKEVAYLYPRLFEFDGHYVRRGKCMPRFEFFNKRYSENEREKIRTAINSFLEESNGSTVLLNNTILV